MARSTGPISRRLLPAIALGAVAAVLPLAGGLTAACAATVNVSSSAGSAGAYAATAYLGGAGPAQPGAGPSSLVAQAVPTNVSPPTITGEAQEGNTLTEVHGDWTGDPTTYGYQWQHCNSTGTVCSDVGGATSQSYLLTDHDSGFRIRVEEWATNAAGTSNSPGSVWPKTSKATRTPPRAMTPSWSGSRALIARTDPRTA